MNNHKRLLAAYLGPHRKYLNPYTENVIECLGNLMQIEFFGPGYNESLEQFVNKQKNYDFVIFDSISLEAEKFLKIKQPFSASFSKGTNLELQGYLNKIDEILLNVRYKKIFIANMDYYNVSDVLLKKLEVIQPLTISMTDENTTVNYLTLCKTKKFDYDDIQEKLKPTDNWMNYVAKFKYNVISVPHFTKLEEFNFSSASNRNFKLDIPGIGYRDRKKYIHKLRLIEKLHLFYQSTKYKFFLLKNKVKGRLTENEIHSFRIMFQNRLRKSEVNITTGGPLKFPVRKFYEIPTQKTILLCEPFIGAEHHGFLPDINYLTLSGANSETLYDIFNQSSDFLEKIRCNGFEHVLVHHSMQARLQQLQSTLELILNEEFNGSIWLHGEYVNL